MNRNVLYSLYEIQCRVNYDEIKRYMGKCTVVKGDNRTVESCIAFVSPKEKDVYLESNKISFVSFWYLWHWRKIWPWLLQGQIQSEVVI